MLLQQTNRPNKQENLLLKYNKPFLDPSKIGGKKWFMCHHPLNKYNVMVQFSFIV